ncbi:methylated-DNA--[protein]-cysteine S-methyltransferase [Abyssisolibacter fermentans]|uniref:methylated-DNA--[protein]-cysteine S-methyltransferase n=1 Tax=Abyssisolibacter fermentans TaxID=1766203 RepID=UPI00083590FE|nr:methylated-DNA--[protein]-cysteine S-methyltransferase [Abyssisolibacter fermentans]
MIEKFYGYYRSVIGLIEIICTENEVISVIFVDSPNYETKENKIVKEVINQLDEYFNGKRKIFNLPLKVDGTKFQNETWYELLKIPYGTTITYKDMAIALGNPKASRAVGNANGKNKIWIIIPCHRVIGAKGKLTGYAGGIERKKWLIEHEIKNK